MPPCVGLQPSPAAQRAVSHLQQSAEKRGMSGVGGAVEALRHRDRAWPKALRRAAYYYTIPTPTYSLPTSSCPAPTSPLCPPRPARICTLLLYPPRPPTRTSSARRDSLLPPPLCAASQLSIHISLLATHH
ncbi:hypothetical protein EJ04DRAFT_274847 [Polyplosphaeria fusca]|uniref:Uncharacterized protein n=1 Tax=Polyplosphaeria fusca TaxID=682080 RepID=A0A9P4V1K5_9PLEO|nr:hypothetical protein EJ04DRAFT_274847 [Polyplosphaeria fusca]